MTLLTDTPPLLRFADIAMRFPGGITALEHVTFDVAPGEFVSVVGPSGCGKSTLLRIASHLETPSDGETNVTTDKVGFVFQDATLLPWRDVLANVELLAELRKLPKSDRRATAQAAIKLVGLEGFEHQLPKALSGGMKMRVSLARSLALSPELFLFDEPFGALDEITRETLNDELLRLFTQQRFGALFITHSIAEAVYLSTRVVVMSGRPGKVVAVIDNPMPFPRQQSDRFTPEFTELTSKVSIALREGHAQ